ncbi:putative quinol monooxygenase [Saccharothrix sp. ST-888]|uniref:putative quinol monooxygenase n=1 Tax=Saccharothrix sp. ST-888 TaxID=1427391 RepID=UPI0005ECFE32|nr:antibiotic biosynthesis monooxygenase [Saccharothrix sp. ST-888]KJK55815.1 antibiotic biosynthesis monooxygenase [Saccharothrix sp. ST-888]
MTKIGLLARFEAKPEYAEQIAAMLRDALRLAQQEEATVTWFAFREGPTGFGIFDTFDDESGRRAHLEGAIAAALLENAPTMLVGAPDIRPVDVLAAKLP